jgi:hypothetical protein
VLAGTLVGVILGLASASLLAKAVEGYLGPDQHRGLQAVIGRFDLDRDGNIPSWYTSVSLLGTAVLLAAITLSKRRAGDRFTVHWAMLSAGFFYLSVDEAAKLHRLLIMPICRRLAGYGLPQFTWVPPAAILVAVLALAYLKFLSHLPRRTRWLFVAAAAIYLGGAMVMDTLSSAWGQQYGMESFRYVAATTIEEVMEMLGVVLFIYGLLDYLRGEANTWVWTIVK